MGFDRIGLDWTGSDLMGFGWIGLDCLGLDSVGLGWTDADQIRVGTESIQGNLNGTGPRWSSLDYIRLD